MSIPLDRLYYYIKDIARKVDKDTLIYRYWPHGSKNIDNLEVLEGPIVWVDMALGINITCHDQEPLNYGLRKIDDSDPWQNILKSLNLFNFNCHNLVKYPSIYDKICLLHSEKRSKHVASYQNNQCVPVYYWSHAIISLDWFRYAIHVTQQKQVTKTFLIYNRAWSGTREYRLYFADLLVKSGLYDYCKTTVNPIEPELGIDYKVHKFENSVWKPQTVLENYFPASGACSNYSADFDIQDYEATDIEIVLETLFDDDRLHLTEKSLRPIACGQPFVLAGTYGSLEYLRSYGFKTFGDIWDESYDSIEEPQERLHSIINLMQQIVDWDSATKERKLVEAQAIAEYNKQHFFSKEFFNLVSSELTNNLIEGLTQIKSQANFQVFFDLWKHRLTFEEIRNFLGYSIPGQNPGIYTIDRINYVLDRINRQ